MKIVNETRNFVISDNSDIAYSLFSRLRGLMLSKKRDLVLVSSRQGIKDSSIHMLFMRFPIDVIWLNSEKRVIDLRIGLLPFNLFRIDTWKIYKPKKPAKYVIELGSGKIGNTEIGDSIKFLHT